MSSYAETIESIKTSVGAIQNPTVTPHHAWLAKIAKGGAELKTIESSIKEQGLAYLSTMIPQTIPNTTALPNAGSLAAAVDAAAKKLELAQDAADTVTALSNYQTLRTQVVSRIEEEKVSNLASLNTAKNSLPLSRRHALLYADSARAQVESVQASVQVQAELKKELVKF